MGAKGKYNASVLKEIATAIETGGSDIDACTMAGISKETFYNWLNEKPDFVDLVTRARTLGKMKRIERITNHAAIDWRADAWYLERRWPEEFAQTLIIKVDPADLALLKRMGFSKPSDAWLAFMENAKAEYELLEQSEGGDKS